MIHGSRYMWANDKHSRLQFSSSGKWALPCVFSSRCYERLFTRSVNSFPPFCEVWLLGGSTTRNIQKVRLHPLPGGEITGLQGMMDGYKNPGPLVSGEGRPVGCSQCEPRARRSSSCCSSIAGFPSLQYSWSFLLQTLYHVASPVPASLG